MYHGNVPGKIPIARQLLECRYAIDELVGAVNSTLADVLVAQKTLDRNTLITAWYTGMETIQIYQSRVEGLLRTTQPILERQSSAHWQTFDSMTNTAENIAAECHFYTLITHIAYGEETIDILQKKLRKNWNDIHSMYRFLNTLLTYIGVDIIEGSRCTAQEQLAYEINSLLCNMEAMMQNPRFDCMQHGDQNEYHRKWHHYVQKAHDLDIQLVITL